MATAETTNIWQMEVSSGGGDVATCPPGNYPGRVAGLVDVGHQTKTYSGETKEARELVLFLEITRKRPDGRPFVLPARYTWSLNAKAKFRPVVEAITGKVFKEGEKFDPTSLLGRPVMVSVTNSQAGEKTYDNVAGISQFPEGFPEPAFQHPVFAWSVLEGTPPPEHDWLPYVYGKSVRELAEQSRERRGSAPAPAPAAVNGIPKAGGETADDAYPF